MLLLACTVFCAVRIPKLDAHFSRPLFVQQASILLWGIAPTVLLIGWPPEMGESSRESSSSRSLRRLWPSAFPSFLWDTRRPFTTANFGVADGNRIPDGCAQLPRPSGGNITGWIPLRWEAATVVGFAAAAAATMAH